MAPTFNIIIIIITTITIILFKYTVQDQGKEAASKNLAIAKFSKCELATKSGKN